MRMFRATAFHRPLCVAERWRRKKRITAATSLRMRREEIESVKDFEPNILNDIICSGLKGRSDL